MYIYTVVYIVSEIINFCRLGAGSHLKVRAGSSPCVMCCSAIFEGGAGSQATWDVFLPPLLTIYILPLLG